MNRAELRRMRLESIRSVSESLSSAEPAPDLTGPILDRVHVRRAFLSRRTRRLVWATRLGVTASVALIVGAVALAHRLTSTRIAPGVDSAPLSAVISSAERDACASLGSIRSRLDSVGTRPTASVFGALLSAAPNPAPVPVARASQDEAPQAPAASQPVTDPLADPSVWTMSVPTMKSAAPDQSPIRCDRMELDGLTELAAGRLPSELGGLQSWAMGGQPGAVIGAGAGVAMPHRPALLRLQPPVEDLSPILPGLIGDDPVLPR